MIPMSMLLKQLMNDLTELTGMILSYFLSSSSRAPLPKWCPIDLRHWSLIISSSRAPQLPKWCPIDLRLWSLIMGSSSCQSPLNVLWNTVMVIIVI